VVGFFSNYLDAFFGIYTFFSLCVLALFTFSVLRQKEWHILRNIRFADFGLKVYILPILLFAFIVLFFHTLFLEYDAISSFFPYAQSISLTGSMKYNVYDQTALSTGMPPVLPIIYAWAFRTVGGLNSIGVQNDLQWFDLFRPIPLAYFLLTACVIYLIAREILQKKHAFLSVIIFMSFSVTTLTLSAFTYYLDLGFVFYLVSALLCSIRALKTRKPIWFFLTGTASSLLLLAKELSIFIIPLIFSIFLLFFSIKYRRVIFAILSTLPYYVIFIYDTQGFPIERILIRQLPVFALTAIFYYLSKTVKNTGVSLTWKNFVQFLVPFIPSVVFFVRGIAFLDSLYSIFCWGPAFNDAITLFNNVTGTSRAIELTGFFRWDLPFLSLGLGLPYLIPILFSVVCVLQRKDKGDKLVNLLVLMMLLTLLETMSFTLVGSQAESRRMYFFSPILAILAANGLLLFDDFLKSKYFIYLCMLFNSLVMGYIWLYRFPFQSLLELAYLKKRLGLTSPLDLAFFSLVFGGFFIGLPLAQKKLRIEKPSNSEVMIQTRKRVHAFPLELKNLRIEDQTASEGKVHTRRKAPAFPVEHITHHFQSFHSIRIKFQRRRRIICVSLFTLSCLLVVYPTIPLWVEGSNEGFLSLQHDVYQPSWEDGILIVSNYYTSQIDDHYVTLSFGGAALRWFANRSIIDLSTTYGVHSTYGLLKTNDSEYLISKLGQSEIRYFLIPTRNNTFFDLYSGFRANCYLFEFIESNPHSFLIKKFAYYQLYKLDL